LRVILYPKRPTEESSRREERIVDERLSYSLRIYQFGKSGDIAYRLGKAQGNIAAFLLYDGFAVAEYAWCVEEYNQSEKKSCPVNDCSKMTRGYRSRMEP
jgi:hypothetical protein